MIPFTLSNVNTEMGSLIARNIDSTSSNQIIVIISGTFKNDAKRAGHDGYCGLTLKMTFQDGADLETTNPTSFPELFHRMRPPWLYHRKQTNLRSRLSRFLGRRTTAWSVRRLHVTDNLQ